MNFLGFERPDGSAGIRNHVLVIPGGLLGTKICEFVEGVKTILTADSGSGRTSRDRETVARALIGLGRNPNVASVIVHTGGLGTGYPELNPTRLADEIAQKKVAVIDDETLRIFNMFLSGNAEIKPEYHSLMAKIAQALKSENVRILIRGHTDNQKIKFSAWFDSNWQLSTARAESAAIALSRYEFPKARISSEGLADKEPIAPNDTAAGRALNRRIDIYFKVSK